MQDRHAGLGQRLQFVRQVAIALLAGHDAAHDRILPVNAGNFVGVLDGPGIGFPGARAGAYHGGFLGKAVVGHGLIDGVPLCLNRASPQDGSSHDVVPLGQQGQINGGGIPADAVRPEDPRLPGSLRLRHEHRHAGDSKPRLASLVVTVVARSELRPPARSVGIFFGEVNVRILGAVIIGFREGVVHDLGPDRGGRLNVLFNEIGNGLEIDQAVRMMAGAFFAHDADPAAALMIDVLDDIRVFLQDKIEGPADVEQRHVVLDQLPDSRDVLRVDAGIVGVDAGDLVRVRGCPGVFIHPAFAHANERRFLGQPVLFREKGIPGIPRLTRIDVNEADVKAALEQFNLGLRLVVKVTASPGPRPAESCPALRPRDG